MKISTVKTFFATTALSVAVATSFGGSANALPMLYDKDANDCKNFTGETCAANSAQKTCNVGKNDAVKCVSCEDSNKDGTWHYTAPHTCTQTISPEDPQVDSEF